MKLLTRSQLNGVIASAEPDHDICFAIDNGDGTWSPVISHVQGGQPRTMSAPDEKYGSEARAIGAALARSVKPREDFPGKVATKDDLRRW